MTALEIAAHHEAGHAVLARRFGRRIREVTIDESGCGSTHCVQLSASARNTFPDRVWRERVREEIHICLGGPATERILGISDPPAWEVDIRRARYWLDELGLGAEAIDSVFRCTRDMLTQPNTWGEVRMIAARLIEDGYLSGREIRRICRGRL